MENQSQSRADIQYLDDIAKSFQRESEALREMLRSREMTISALKAHALSLRANVKDILEALIDKVDDDEVRFHARNMINAINKVDVAGD